MSRIKEPVQAQHWMTGLRHHVTFETAFETLGIGQHLPAEAKAETVCHEDATGFLISEGFGPNLCDHCFRGR